MRQFVFTRLRRFPFLLSAVASTGLLTGAALHAVDPAPKPAALPPAMSAAATAALRFAKQDVELWKARVAELSPLTIQARKKTADATQPLAAIKDRLQIVNKEAAEAQATLKALVPKPSTSPVAPVKPAAAPAKALPAPAPAAAAKALPAPVPPAVAKALPSPNPSTKAPSEPATPPADPAKVATAKARVQETTETQKNIRRELTQAEQTLKQAETARDALAKELAEAETLLKQSEQRIVLLSKTPQTAKPENARLLQTFTAPRPVLTARWDLAGKGFFAGLQGSDVLQYDLYRSGGFVHELKGHHSWVASLAVAPVEPVLITAAYNGHLIWWGTSGKMPTLQRDLVAHKGFVRAVAFSPDGRLVATCGNDAVVRVWSASGTLLKELAGHASHIYNVAFHPSGRFLISGDLMGNLKQWDTGTWQLVRELDARVLEKYDEVFVAHCGGIRSIDFSSDGRQLVVSGVSEVTNAFAGVAVPTAVLFDWETGKRTKVMKPQNPTEGSCWGVRFSPAGDFIVGCGGRGSGSLWFWKPTEEKSFFDLRLPNVPYDVEFHPDGLRLLLPMYDSTIRVYDLGPKLEPAATTSSAPVKK